MTEPPTPRQTVAPHTWTTVDGLPDVEIYHDGPGTIPVMHRRTPGTAGPVVGSSSGYLAPLNATADIEWDHE